MKIVLLGYMGSGKSTIGKSLAAQAGVKFIDLDDHIEAAENQTIAEIFKDKGELYFRKKEHHYLMEVLHKNDDLVLATGGGTPCYGKNLEAMLMATKNVFYLKVSLKGLVERLGLEKAQRPLIKEIPMVELPEFIGKHLFERSFYYHRARHTIICDGKSIEDIGIEILSLSI